MSCSADEFFEAVRQLAEMSNLPGYFASHFKEFEDLMVKCNYAVGVEEHADLICDIIN